MISVQGLTKDYGGRVILNDVSFVIPPGSRIGLVGANGTGKTTLLKLLMKLEEPSAGTVSIHQEQIGYVPQKLNFPPGQTVHEYLAAGLSEDWEDYKIDLVLAQVGLTTLDHHHPLEKLSGGQRSRVGLARVLLDEPTFLLLDEPTNNLDMASITWLEQWLRSFPGSFLVISHDRAFLDKTVNKILELDWHSHTIVSYPGNYSYYVTEKQRRFAAAEQEFQRFELKRRKMEDWLAEKKQQLSAHPNPKVGKQLRAMKHRYDREITQQTIAKPLEQKTINVSEFGQETHQKKVAFYLKEVVHPLFTIPEIVIHGADRIYLGGANGSGKTTLVKTLLGQLHDHQGVVERGTNIQVGYFSQGLDILRPEATVIDEFMRLTEMTNLQNARRVLGALLFTGNMVQYRIEQLSEGEKVRLIIGVLRHYDNQFLILDEPTNHLDIASREMLEAALREYRGGLIVISHDRYFVKSIQLNRVLVIQHGEVYERK